MNFFESVFRREQLPLLVLLCALSTLVLSDNDRRHFSRFGHHSRVSLEHLSIARNLSPATHFLMFNSQILKSDGTVTYDVYNRFPVGGYILIKLAILPFGNDLAAQTYAARTLLLLFFCAAAYLAFCSLVRLTANPWTALTATLWTFSSYYGLYYNDMIHPKTSMDLFGVLLVFLGMTIFIQDGRFFQLLVKVCVALLLGWHVFGLLLPFIALGIVRESKPHLYPLSRPLDQLKSVGRRLFRSRFVKLGLVALLFGILILGMNFTNEYSALNGRRALTELPSFRSMQNRMGLNQRFNAREISRLAWEPFLKEQARRLGLMSLPYVVLGAVGMLDDQGYPQEDGAALVIIGTGMSVACLIGLAFGRYKMLWTSLALSGFCWALPMRHNTAFHDYEALFYIGVPMVFLSQVLAGGGGEGTRTRSDSRIGHRDGTWLCTFQFTDEQSSSRCRSGRTFRKGDC